jgi:hypothetical protein
VKTSAEMHTLLGGVVLLPVLGPSTARRCCRTLAEHMRKKCGPLSLLGPLEVRGVVTIRKTALEKKIRRSPIGERERSVAPSGISHVHRWQNCPTLCDEKKIRAPIVRCERYDCQTRSVGPPTPFLPTPPAPRSHGDQNVLFARRLKPLGNRWMGV